MKYGEKYETSFVDPRSKKEILYPATYKYAEWKYYHTNKEGDGLWDGERQIAGTCQFTVAGCKTEKAAKAKIRKYVNELR